MTTLNLIERSPNFIDMAIPDETEFTSYAVYVAKLLDDAYDYANAGINGVGGVAAANLLFTIPKGTSFRSPGIVRRGWGRVDESNRGMTRIKFDLMDYFGPAAPNVPHDDNVGYFIVRPYSPVSASLLEPDRIFVVPSPGFFNSPTPALTITGTAPNTGVGTAVGDLLSKVGTTGVPPGAMHIVFPKMAANIMLRNLDGLSHLLYAFSVGSSCAALPPSTNLDATGQISAKDILFEGDGANPTFTGVFTMANSGP
jgi:hypothetical protein